MPSLRDYRDRIKSVKSTRKITSAMKMVAASKLKRAQDQAEAAHPYARTMSDMLARVAGNVTIGPMSSKFLVGTGSDQRHLLVVVSADRGLCGGFNANIIKEARKTAFALLKEGKEVSILCVGRKVKEALRRDLKKNIWKSFTGITGKTRVDYAEAQDIRDYIVARFDGGDFDVCTLLYNEFQSVLSQKPAVQQLIPFDLKALDAQKPANDDESAEGAGLDSPYDFEPAEDQILDALLPRNIGVQIFGALLDSAAGEQAARMTAMDNATRNAGDMINDLSLQYNRARQAYITKELIEIISGAEAL